MMDEHMDVLSNTHRRRLLVDLMRENPLSDGTDGPSREYHSKERAISMRHVHLPKLEDYGYIDWDRSSNRVTKGPQFHEIEPLLTRLFEDQETPSDDGRSK